jgi:hypothetical protein
MPLFTFSPVSPSLCSPHKNHPLPQDLLSSIKNWLCWLQCICHPFLFCHLTRFKKCLTLKLFSLNLYQSWWRLHLPLLLCSLLLSLSQTGPLSEDNRDRNGQGEMGKKGLPKSHCHFSQLLSDSYDPGTTNVKWIANLNDMWLMIAANFLSWPPCLPPKTKPLNVSKHS